MGIITVCARVFSESGVDPGNEVGEGKNTTSRARADRSPICCLNHEEGFGCQRAAYFHFFVDDEKLVSDSFKCLTNFV